MKSFAIYLCVVGLLSCWSCTVTKNEHNVDKNNSSQNFTENMSVNSSDIENIIEGTSIFDGSGDGVLGRKIIFRAKKNPFFIINETGKVAIKICINKEGLVTYAEILTNETTMKNKENLRMFLKTARNYKYEPDLNAPKEQCGKLKFIVESSTNSNNNYHLKDGSIRKQK